MAQPTQDAYADAIITNLLRLTVLVQVVIANPTPANVDAAVNAIESGTSTGLLQLKPTTSLDGESYNWESYLVALGSEVDKWILRRQQLANPWEIRTYAR